MFLSFCSITKFINEFKKENLGYGSANMRTQVQHECKNLSIIECAITPSRMNGDSRSLEHWLICLDKTLTFWFYERPCLKEIMWRSRQKVPKVLLWSSHACAQVHAPTLMCMQYTHAHRHNIILHVSNDLHP